jgi:hypothetical protein
MKRGLSQEMVIGIIISLIVLALFLGGLYLGATGKLSGLGESIRGFFR